MKQKKYKGIKKLADKYNITYKQAEYCISKAEKACTSIILGKDIK